MLFLSLPDLLHVADRTLAGDVLVRDHGLLESAVARPRTTVYGQDAYPSLAEKAAALTQSLARNHALADGNKRLALAGLIAFLGINGWRLTWTNDEAYEVIIDIATGRLNDIESIAAEIRNHLRTA